MLEMLLHLGHVLEQEHCEAALVIKVKSHRGEPINKRADTLAERGREISYDYKRWDDRTDQMTFEVRKGDTTVCSVWTNSIRNSFLKQAGWAKLQEARAAAAKHWTERVWYRHNQGWLQSSREGPEASKSGSFKDEREWGKKCFADDDDVFYLFFQKQKRSRPAENGETSDAYMEYGLPPPRRIKQRRDQKMAKEQVHTMATAEEVAPGSDGHFSVWTTDGEVWLQGNSRVHTV
jgi:hypothetical protein